MVDEDRFNIWNSLEIEEVYIEKGGTNLSHRNRVDKVMANFVDEMVSLHSSGIATLLLFRKYGANTFIIIVVSSTILFNSFVHSFSTSLNIIRSSKEQGCASWEHCNMCATVSSAFPLEHVVSPV